jgi:hypothetical protein
VTRRETFARLVPAPLAAVTLVLVVLILITPVLFSTGPPPAGSLLTQAELIVDHVTGQNITHFYIRGLSTTVRYSEMTIDAAGNFSWTGAFPSGPLGWNVSTNGSDVLTLVLATTENPVALNVTAFYQVSGSSAYYEGEIAFDFATPSGSSTEQLYSATSTPGLVLSGPTPVASLPVTILLVDVGSRP